MNLFLLGVLNSYSVLNKRAQEIALLFNPPLVLSLEIMMSLFDDEQIMRTYTKDIEKETERKTAEKMIRTGKMTLEEIVECVSLLSFDELKEIEAEVMQLA